MRKRKNSETGLDGYSVRSGKIALAIGITLLTVVSIGGGWLLFSQRPMVGPLFPPRYASPTRSYYPTPYLRSQAASTKTSTPSPVTMSARDARLVMGMTSGEILTNLDGAGTRSTGLRGSDPVLAPDGRTLAYLRDKQLIVYHDGQEQIVNVPGAAMMPAWSVDGQWLAFVSRETDYDVVYRVDLASLQRSRVLSVPEIAAPPLSNPATDRLLIVERVGAKKTAFYTVDPMCAAQVAQGGCKASRKDIATADHSVNWASYHPSATRIAFSDRDDGGLYLLNTANGDITPLVEDGQIKRRPAFSKDGAWLAYVSEGGQLYALHLEDMVSQTVALGQVASVDWAR
jgi:hypothetical protein